MMRYLFIILLFSCSTRVNRYKEVSENRKVKIGKWIEKEISEDDIYISKGRYKNGFKIGVWKTYLNNKIYQKDKIKDSTTVTKIFYTNGKLQSNGKSILTYRKDFIRWHYVDKWYFYDEKGQLIYIKTYHVNREPTVDSIR